MTGGEAAKTPVIGGTLKATPKLFRSNLSRSFTTSGKIVRDVKNGLT